jgi:hypothetical protein
MQKHGRWKTNHAKDGYVKDDHIEYNCIAAFFVFVEISCTHWRAVAINKCLLLFS